MSDGSTRAKAVGTGVDGFILLKNSSKMLQGWVWSLDSASAIFVLSVTAKETGVTKGIRAVLGEGISVLEPGATKGIVSASSASEPVPVKYVGSFSDGRLVE